MTQGNGSGAAQPRTTLQFFGQAQGVKVNVPKGGFNDDSGSIDITFRVKAPKRPNDPRRHRSDWELDRAKNLLAEHGGVRPDPKEDKKATSAFDNAQKTIETITNRRRIEDEHYARELAAHGPALLAYAQLVGLVAVFGDQRLEIALAPADQDLLPGMGITLALPDGQAAQGQDDEDWVDEDEDFEDEVDEDLVEAAAEMAAG